METHLINRYAANINGVLSCYDRILMIGTLPGACYAGKDSLHCTKFAEPLRERIRDCALEACKVADLEIEHANISHIP